MWVFDGETWIDEGATISEETKRPAETSQFDLFYPELQVIEVVPTPRAEYVPYPIP